MTVHAEPRYAVVVSHDCEFDDRKRAHFLAARLQELPKKERKDPEKLQILFRGNDYRGAAQARFPVALDSFIVEPVAGVFDDPMLVNFASITPFAMKFRLEMLRLERAEMDSDQRSLLREKLAVFFGRHAEDVPAEYKPRLHLMQRSSTGKTSRSRTTLVSLPTRAQTEGSVSSLIYKD